MSAKNLEINTNVAFIELYTTNYIDRAKTNIIKTIETI